MQMMGDRNYFDGLRFENFQFGNRTKMLIQGKERNLVMQAYLGNYDMYLHIFLFYFVLFVTTGQGKTSHNI